MRVKVKKAKRGLPWTLEGQPEFDFTECYIHNYQPLDLKKYEGDRNYEFYKLQNELLEEYNKTGKTNEVILWKMFPFIEGVVSSLAKKNVCTGCNVPDFDGKSLEASLRVMNYYKSFPYFRARKLENVAFHKVREVFLDKNLQIEERSRDLEKFTNIAVDDTGSYNGIYVYVGNDNFNNENEGE